MLLLPVLCWTAVHGRLIHTPFPQAQTPAYENSSAKNGGEKKQSAATRTVNIFTAELTCMVSN